MSDAEPGWRNWSGAIASNPAAIEHPSDADAIADVLARAARSGSNVRPLGSGHSSSPLCATDGILLSLDRCAGLEHVDLVGERVSVRAGTVLHDLGRDLLAHGLAMQNLGDIDRQALAGALATGTHGTGRALGNIASRVRALRLVTAEGEEREIEACDADLLCAARVSLGTLGVITAATLRVQPAYRLHERIRRISLDEAASCFDAESRRHRHFECFYFPRHDFTEAKALDATAAEPASVSDRDGERIGWSAEILASIREEKFHEMEYAVPESAGIACFRALAARIRSRHPQVAWPLEIRTVAADDAWLSPAFGRATCAISVHQSGRREHEPVFRDLEPIFWEHGGRPHWGKWHSCDARRLAPLYPRFQDFLAVRDRLDPAGRFLNAHLRDMLLG